MKKSLILTTLLLGAMTFSGCGSSDSPKGDSTNNSSNNASNNGSSNNGSSNNSSNNGSSNLSSILVPVSTNTVCDPKAVTFEDTTYDVKYAADGDITIMCKTQSDFIFGEYALVAGVNTLTITQLDRVESYAFNTNKMKGTGVDTYNYKDGSVHHNINGTENGKTIKYDCTEIYPSPLPLTLTDKESIEDLIDWEGDDNDRISTTCPESYYADIDEEDEDDMGVGTAKFVTNYTLTDSDGKKHYITESGDVTFK